MNGWPAWLTRLRTRWSVSALAYTRTIRFTSGRNGSLVPGGLGVGDRIPFSPPNAPQEVVEYEIAGVVSTPGWQWVTKFSGMRRHFVRTFTIVFADASRVQSDFHLSSNEFFWMNLDGSGSIDEVEKSLQTIAERHAGSQFTAGEYGQVTAHCPFARLTATDTVRTAITMVANEVIWGISKLPLITLAITSLAVANTIAASVRARRWQLGVLRAVGITRSQIVRLILAEAGMITIVACLLSLAFGLIAGWCSVGMSRYSGMFYSPPNLSIPWQALCFGVAATLALSLTAALWPAIVIGRAEPLELLQNAD
jgi:putative ABC transport system permease protein